MVKKKGFLAGIMADREQAKRQRERDQRAAELAERKRTRAFAAAQAKALREEERKATAKAKEVERRAAAKEKEAERVAILKEKQALRLAEVKAKAAEREAVRQAAATAREARAAQVQQVKQDLVDQAARRTADVSRRCAEFSGLLKQTRQAFPQEQQIAEQVFNRGGPQEFAEFVASQLITAEFPTELPRKIVAEYDPAARELMVACELPGQHEIPKVTEFRVSRGAVVGVPRKSNEPKIEYSQLIARVVLRVLSEALAYTSPTLVDEVLLNAHVSTVDPATGLDTRPCLVNAKVRREQFAALKLTAAELDPIACLRGLNSIVSPNPYDLESVKPMLFYSENRYRTIAGLDLAINLDSRIDLLSLSPTEFETLVRQLFEAQGMKSWQTQSSNDEGVDAVVVNEDPVMGGVVIVQAKRYSKCVSTESVSALLGNVNLHHATRGILVTTSWVGPSSHRQVEALNGRLQIIEGRQLKHMLREFMNMDVLISLPKLGPGWDRQEVS